MVVAEVEVLFLTFMGPCIVNVFFKYNQQDAMLYNILYSRQCCTCWLYLKELRYYLGICLEELGRTAKSLDVACLGHFENPGPPEYAAEVLSTWP